MKRFIPLCLSAMTLTACGSPVVMATSPVRLTTPAVGAQSVKGLRQAAKYQFDLAFNKADKNTDGVLSVDEARTSMADKTFAEFDRDRNKVLDRKEFARLFKKLSPGFQDTVRAMTLDHFTKWDVNKDKLMSLDEMRAVVANDPDPQQVQTMLLFHQADRNHDQMLNASELEDCIAWVSVTYSERSTNVFLPDQRQSQSPAQPAPPAIDPVPPAGPVPSAP